MFQTVTSERIATYLIQLHIQIYVIFMHNYTNSQSILTPFNQLFYSRREYDYFDVP